VLAGVSEQLWIFSQDSFLFQTVVGPSTAGDIHAADVKSLSAIDMR
jgi:hypothetical protein